MTRGKIVWLRSAKRDLAIIHQRIAQDAPRRAAAFVKRLKNAAKILENYPEIGSIVPELEPLGLREIIHGNYRIIYRHEERRVVILGVIHGACVLDEGFLPEM